MTTKALIHEAERVVAATRATLPEELRTKAAAVPVVIQDWPTEEILGEEFEPDILGLFVGEPHGGGRADGGTGGELPAQIFLFVENVFDFAEGDLEVFRDEIRLTYLHELGHYFGWDEADLAERGLD